MCADEFFPQRPNFLVGLAEIFCQELATLTGTHLKNFKIDCVEMRVFQKINPRGEFLKF
jgi:hypothetical protein